VPLAHCRKQAASLGHIIGVRLLDIDLLLMFVFFMGKLNLQLSVVPGAFLVAPVTWFSGGPPASLHHLKSICCY